MRKLIERFIRRGSERPPGGAAVRQPNEPRESEEAERKLSPELSLLFMLSHLEDDGPVRLDGVKLGVYEVMGLEIDEPKLGAFAGALNALDFPAQLLIRQHPPRLDGMREKLRETRSADLPPQTRAAAESLDRLLTELEDRDGILDRRFYAVCEFGRIDDLRGLLARAALSVHPLGGKATIHYTIPTPEDSPIAGGDAAEVVFSGGVMSMGVVGGEAGTRTRTPCGT